MFVNGTRWRAWGANIYDLLDSSTSEAQTRLTEVANMGCTTVRTWAFSSDGTAGAAMKSRLDSALTVAEGLGIKLLLTLGNQFNDWGGPDKFGLTQAAWFTEVNSTWINQVTSLVGAYQNRPGVFAWEVLNEPRPNNDTVSMSWLDTVAGIIKQHDPTHLVSSGSEGFLGGPPYPTADANSGASPDLSIPNLNSGSNIDIVTAHIYTKYMTADHSPDTVKTAAAIAAMKSAADALNKPLVLGEVGFDPNDFGGNSARTQFFNDVAAAAFSSDIEGALAWNWGRPPATSFTLSPGDTASETIMANWLSTLSGGTIVPPTNVTTRISAGVDDNFHSFNSVSLGHNYPNSANDVAVGLFSITETALGGAMRFKSIAVPKNALVKAAYLTLTSSSSDSANTVNSKIRGVAADSAVMPANDAAFHAPGYTTAVVLWDNIGAWENGSNNSSPDIKSIIQEIVNRPGWVSGNNIVLIWDDLDRRSTQSSDVLRRGRSYNNDPANAPQLTILYT